MQALFDSFSLRHYKQGVTGSPETQTLRAQLLGRQLANGSWGFCASSAQACLEPTCLALLALRPDRAAPLSKTVEFLRDIQRQDGSWPAFGSDDGASGLTGLAVFTLSCLGESDHSLHRGVDWLLDARGRESHWIWRWKFRTTDTRVRFNPAKFGWPWEPGTCSWVVPTAFAVLALKRRIRSDLRRKLARRVERGVAMILDRVCSEGGWNAGNGLVYGRPMSAHIDVTALALLALESGAPNKVVESSLHWLERESHGCHAPWSLAWTVLALDLYERPVSLLRQRLAEVTETRSMVDNATLAITVLALDCPTCGNPFKAPE